MSRDAQGLIEAGGIVAAVMTGDSVDTVTARSYSHPALDGRVVVRLVPATLGPAEDLAMEFLGFAPAGPPVDVGTGRRQALGFPAWAIINDPANGHHALALVKDVERLARMARTRPGAAKDGFGELAIRLGKAVPHFLPTFFEQAGRAYLAVDNKPTAASMFGRAREAERVHALVIDEDRQREVFLEFAFAGALTAKSLSQHARDLVSRAKPGEAYDLFLRICLERVAGGLPPYAAMAQDLRRLAKAAGLGAAGEDERVLLGLLDSPSLPRAPLAFWKAYEPAMVRLAKADVAVQAALLDMLPTSEQDGVEAMWLNLLESTGAVAGLVEIQDQGGVARPRGGASGWLARAAQWRRRGWRGQGRSVGMLRLVERMAPRLRAEAKALDIGLEGHSGFDVDLLDLCLSLDLLIALPQALPSVPLASWLNDTSPGHRDLSALAGAGWAREALMVGMDQVLVRPQWDQSADKLSLAKVRPLLEGSGAREILACWLRRLADDAESAALPGLEQAFARVSAAALGVVLGVEPQAATRLASVDAGRALARTLRIGLFDEFVWPALETVVPEFPQSKVTPTQPAWNATAFRVADAWPALILVSQARVTVVGPDGVLLRHDVRQPPAAPGNSWWSVMADWSDGQVLVSGRSATSGGYGYWSGKPSEVFDIAGRESWGYDGANALTLPLPGGGRTGGGRPLMPGDKTFSEVRPVVSDGKSWWRCDVQGWREYDPQTGSPGRRSRPAFFEAALAGGDAKLLDGLCHLAPVPTGLGGSPLGTADGLLGWRAVVMPDGSQVGESVDGAVVRLSAEQVRRLNGASPAGASQFPGGGPRVAVLATRLSLLLWDGHCVGSEFKVGLLGERYASGSTVVPPLSWWHVLRPRDVNGSAALRAVTDDQGRALVAGAGKGTAAAIRRVLPGVTDPSLLAGVAGVLEIAVACAKLAQALPAPARAPARAPGGAPLTPKPTHPVLPDSLLTAALSGLSSQMNSYSSYHVRGDAGVAISSLQAAVALVGAPSKKGLRARLGLGREREQPGDLPLTGVEWTVVVGGLGAVALRAATEATTDEERHALVIFLEAVADTPLAEVDGRWREVTLIGKAVLDDLPVVGTVLSTRHGSAVVLQVTARWVGAGAVVPLVTALEHSPSGSFGAVAGYTVEDSRVNSGWGGVGRVRELVNLLRTRGPAPWRPEAVASLVASTGITRAEASLLLAGLPRAGSYEHNFLPKHTRETLGLKVAEATAAQPAMTALTSTSRILLAGLAMPANPADLWDRGPDVTAVADMWLRSFGRRADLPDELLGELNAAMRHYHYPAATLLQGLADPDSCKWLLTDKRWSVVDGQLESTGGQGGFDGAALVAAMSALLWLAYRLPKQDPLRANLPRTAERLRQRLNNPELLVATLQDFDVSGLRQVYGHPPAPVTPGQQETLMLGKAGVMVDRGWGQQLYVRPAFLAGSDDPLLKAAGALFGPASAALRLLADPGLDRLLQSLKDTSAGWAQDPLVSAPAVVPLAQEALGVDAAAARLYLQMLVLPDPTDKNIRGWNGWSPAELKKAGAALLSTGALVEGKRPRAGRAAFLPGGWLDVLAPMPPIEEWKVDLLGLVPDGRGPLGVTVPSAPLGELFTDAWERVSAGEGPMLQQLETRRRR